MKHLLLHGRRRIMNTKKWIGLGAAVLAAVFLFLLGINLFFRLREKEDGAVILQKVEAVRDLVAPELKGEPIEYKGIQAAQSGTGSGRKKYSCGDYSFFYDPSEKEVMYILHDTKSPAGKGGSAADTLRERARALLALIKGQTFADLCTVRTETGAAGTSFYFDCEIQGVQVSAGCVDYCDGVLVSAVFQDTGFPDNFRISVSKEEALEIAEKTAEAFLEKKDIRQYSLIDDSVNVTLRLIRSEAVYVCELLYTVPEGVWMPYFSITIDPQSGKVIENANNMT